MNNTNLVIPVLVGSLLIADLKEGQHIDHIPETYHEAPISLIVSYGYNAPVTGSFHP